ncbi:hypothetical protein F9K33_00435 [bacterium]|nr:MAG: hypothetical protein F9K33_00435 [bacterium]
MKNDQAGSDTRLHRDIKQIIILLFITVLLVLLVNEAHSQNKTTFPLQDDSYISYPMGENLIFEGQIAPNYPVMQWGTDQSTFKGNITITPKVILKMYRTRSSPVKTPSYMPKITIQGALDLGSVSLYPFLILSHHSNGQGGETFVTDDANATSINKESGSFATNFIQLGYFFSLPDLDKHYMGISYEHHPVHGWWFGIDPAIQDIYGRRRLHYEYKYLGNIFQFETSYTDIIDKPKGIPKGIFSATAKIKSPVFRKSMWFFASYYQGQDYYNINFNNKTRQGKAGIAIQTKLSVN